MRISIHSDLGSARAPACIQPAPSPVGLACPASPNGEENMSSGLWLARDQNKLWADASAWANHCTRGRVRSRSKCMIPAWQFKPNPRPRIHVIIHVLPFGWQAVCASRAAWRQVKTLSKRRTEELAPAQAIALAKVRVSL